MRKVMIEVFSTVYWHGAVTGLCPIPQKEGAGESETYRKFDRFDTFQDHGSLDSFGIGA